MEKNEYYVIVDIRTLYYMNQGYPVDDITEAEGFTTEEAARKEISKYDDEQKYYEVYKVKEEITRKFKLIPKIQSN